MLYGGCSWNDLHEFFGGIAAVRFVLPSFAKLNLSLRVTGRRDDGYHDLVSLFLRIPSGEVLHVVRRPDPAEGDLVSVEGMELEGENIVARALRLARESGLVVPPLDIEILKSLFPGAGLGAGSGNGAALLRWLAEEIPDPRWPAVARRTGADVPCLFSGFPVTLVSGIGDCIEPLPALSLRGRVLFPDWSVGTKGAYNELDARYPGGYPLCASEARREALRLYKALQKGERVGLLPNDFALPLLEHFPGYRELFGILERSEALAWGITGSGGAAFCLFAAPVPSLGCPEWVRQVLYFS